MGTTLQNGVYLPNEGERNCYAGLKTNWEILDQKVADVTALQQAVAGALHREIVESLPTTDIDPNTIYMVLSGTSATENVYNEFMYVNNAWELIGTSATDLTNYYTKGDVDGLLILKANASDLTSHTGDATIHVTTADKSKWNNGVSQAYVFRYSSTALVASSTHSNTLLDNTDNLKVGDKVIDSDGVLFSITAIDTVNSTFTVGSALIDLALDANVVHTNEINSSGIGIIGAVKEVGGVDFNTLTTQGLYGVNASGSTNNPVTSPCVVQVIKRLNSVIQIVNVSSSAYKSRYIRYCMDITAQSPVWLSWIKFATDDDVVHLSGSETVGGIKNFSDDTYIKSLNFTNEVPSQSSTSSSIMPIITTITYSDSSPSVQARLNFRITANGEKSLYPHENNQYSLGLTSRRWSDFFSYHGNFAGQQQGDEYSVNARTNLTLLANRDTVGQSGCVVDTFRENTAQGTALHILGFGIKENSIRYEGCRFSWLYDDDNNGYVFSLRPTTQGTNRPIKYELGNSSTKWSTFNGINPGALSFPDPSNAIDISGYFDLSLYTGQTYTPSVDGWISLSVTSPNRGSILAETFSISQTAYGVTDPDSTSSYRVCILIPCFKNVAVTFYIRASGGSFNSAKFIPCQGNV